MTPPDRTPAPMPAVKARLVAAWVFVGVPLAYGVTMTVKKALPLFGVQ